MKLIKKDNTLKKSDVQYFIIGILSVLTYIWPLYLSVVFSGFNGTLISVFRYLSYAVTAMTAVIFRNELLALLKRSGVFILLGLSLYITLVLSTLIHGGKTSELVFVLTNNVFFALLLGCALVEKSGYLLKGIAAVYDIIIICSLLSAFVHLPGLKGVENFAATKNVFLRYIYLGIIINAYLDFKDNGDLTVKTLIFMGFVTVSNLMFRSSTGFIVSLVVLVLLLVRKYFFRNNLKIAKARLFFYISIGIGVLVVFLRQLNFYSDAVRMLFDKDATFTGRSDLWDQALVLIRKNPILGCGHLSVSDMQIFGNEHWSSTSCHNIYLDVLVETGIIGLIIFLFMLLFVINSIDGYANSHMAQCFSILFLCYLISYNFEVFFNAGQNIYNFPLLFFLSFCFAGNRKRRRIRIVWKKT